MGIREGVQQQENLAPATGKQRPLLQNKSNVYTNRILFDDTC